MAIMGRNRERGRAGWPDNVYPCKNGYKYRHPVTKKDKWMGTDQAKVFDAARRANAILKPANRLLGQIIGQAHTVKDAISTFRRDDVPARKWAPATAAINEYRLAKIERDIGDRELHNFSVKDAADYLRVVTASPRARQQYRLVLIWIFACAVEDGWMEANPATLTRKTSAPRVRLRLTINSFEAIRAHAAPWLQVAMDLSLQTLLRREDVVSLRREDVRDGHIWVVPGKTEGSTHVRLKIRISAQIQEVLERSRAGIASPYLVHRLPEKARPRALRAAERAHHTQVLPEQLTRAFGDARDACGLFAGENSPPTFHEIRSLGGALYIEAGWTLPQVQALMGHASEQMTQHYMQGHEAPWTEVVPGLDLTAIGRK